MMLPLIMMLPLLYLAGNHRRKWVFLILGRFLNSEPLILGRSLNSGQKNDVKLAYIFKRFCTKNKIFKILIVFLTLSSLNFP